MISGRAALVGTVTIAFVAAIAGAAIRMPTTTVPLRVRAAPNNLPFSNQNGEGVENELAKIVGQELHRPVEYTWWAQRRGFFRSTLEDSLCDVVMGVPSSLDMVRRTKPYYRSTYVF